MKKYNKFTESENLFLKDYSDFKKRWLFDVFKKIIPILNFKILKITTTPVGGVVFIVKNLNNEEYNLELKMFIEDTKSKVIFNIFLIKNGEDILKIEKDFPLYSLDLRTLRQEILDIFNSKEL